MGISNEPTLLPDPIQVLNYELLWIERSRNRNDFSKKIRFIKIDRECDNIPFVSTVTNIVDLCLKIFLFFIPKESVTNWFYMYLNDKSFMRCIILLIPVIGNVIIGIYDSEKKRKLLPVVQQNGLTLKNVSPWFQGDEEIVVKAIRQNGLAILYAKPWLKFDIKITVQRRYESWIDELNTDRRKAFAAMQQNLLVLAFLSPERRADSDLLRKVIQ